MQVVNATPSQLEVDQLLGLRLMLEDALRRAQHAGPHQRATATVLLDATVERATFLVGVSNGLRVGFNDHLDVLISRVKEHLGDRWQPRVLQDVRQLHRARNAAQHEGLGPDRARLPVWASATESYVVGLVDAAFAVDLRRVSLSDALDDFELRAMVATAETHLARRDFRASAEASTMAFDLALRRWEGMHSEGRVHQYSPTGEREVSQQVQSQINDLRSVVSSTALAPDAAEVAWFRAAAIEPELLDGDDAERMLSFAFGWVAALDLAQQSWTPDRRARADAAERRVRTSPGPATVAEVVSIETFDDSTTRAVFRLIGVPDKDSYHAWSVKLDHLLAEGRDTQHWSTVGDNGTVDMTFPTKDAACTVDRLSGCLRAAEGALAADDARREADERAQDRRTREYNAELANTGRPLPSWVNAVKWGIRGIPGHPADGLLLVVDETAASVREPVPPFDAATDNTRRPWGAGWVGLADLLRGDESVVDAYPLGPAGYFAIAPVPTCAQLLDILAAADTTMQGWATTNREREEARGASLDEARAAIVDALARIAAADAD